MENLVSSENQQQLNPDNSEINKIAEGMEEKCAGNIEKMEESKPADENKETLGTETINKIDESSPKDLAATMTETIALIINPDEHKIQCANSEVNEMTDISKGTASVSETSLIAPDKTEENVVNRPEEAIVHSDMEDVTATDNSASQEIYVNRTEEAKNLEEAAALIEQELSAKVANSNGMGSLGLLNQYVSSSDEDSDESDEENDSSEEDENSANQQTTLNQQAKGLFDKVMSKEQYRVISDDDDSDEDSDVEFVGKLEPETISIADGDEELNAFMESCSSAPSGPIKAKGELGIDDLPPIQDLTITVAEEDCIKLGTVSGIVDTLVLVDSIPNFAAVDIDTVLFLDKGNRTLGQVFDVMGNVASPIYCVRFNKPQDIADKNITVGLPVYVAPKTEHTNFIVLSELMNQRGTDASWEDDIEPPEGCHEFSDDEEEREARRAQRQRNHRNRNSNSVSSDTNTDIPNKVTIKQEYHVPRSKRQFNANKRNRTQNQGQRQQFYKDNPGYSNTTTQFVNYYQNQPPIHYDHSWHTAAIHGLTAAGPPPPPPPYSNGQPIVQNTPQGCYPNPFAMQANQPGYNQFSLHAFPPLPPPMTMLSPRPKFPPSKRHNLFNKRFGGPGNGRS